MTGSVQWMVVTSEPLRFSREIQNQRSGRPPLVARTKHRNEILLYFSTHTSRIHHTSKGRCTVSELDPFTGNDIRLATTGGFKDTILITGFTTRIFHPGKPYYSVLRVGSTHPTHRNTFSGLSREHGKDGGLLCRSSADEHLALHPDVVCDLYGHGTST